MSPLAWLALAGCAGAPDPAAEARARDLHATAAVAGLLAAERVVVTRELEAALARGDWARAVEAAAHADPEAVARVLAKVRELEPTVAAPLLADLARRDPSLAEEAERAGVALRYGADLEASLARVAGVRVDHGLAVLELVEDHYVAPPDWAAFVGAAERRAGLLPGAETPPAAGSTRAAAEEALRARVAAGEVREDVLVAEWIDAGLGALDPHTHAVWPTEVQGWEEHHAGVYVGVGLELRDRDGAVVRWPVPGSPAFAAGLHQGDVIVEVDGRAVATAAEAGQALRGAEGTVARVVARRGSDARTFEVARAPIAPDTVMGWTRAADNTWDVWLDRPAGLAYVRFDAFRPHTDDAFDALLEPALPELRGLVLDLRGCPGGDLDAAAQLIDRFVAEGDVVELVGRSPAEPVPEGVVPWNRAVPGHALEGVPVAVLVDGQTASSGEIVAGALDVLADAVVIGDRTFGKGSSQVLAEIEGRPRPDGSVAELGFAVQLTNYRWRLPDGRSPEGGGLTPDEPLVVGGGGAWQVEAARQRREHVRTHADGSPLVVEVPEPRADLPVLPDDPVVVRATLRLRERLIAPE